MQLSFFAEDEIDKYFTVTMSKDFNLIFEIIKKVSPASIILDDTQEILALFRFIEQCLGERGERDKTTKESFR